MKTNKCKQSYRCMLFLKDASDIKLLAPKTHLYGQIIPSAKIVFMTPYASPDKSLPWIGIVQEKTGTEYQQPLLINLAIEGDLMTACGFIENQYMQMPVEVIDRAASYARTPFDTSEMELLWNKKVLIFGAGSGGSKIAMELARAGVGHLILCDPAQLKCENISRHEGDILDIGKPKVQVVAERVYRINPAIHIETYFEDIFDRPADEINRIVKNADIVIAATDKTAKQLLINEFTQKLKIPAVFGGCYEEAFGGEVFFTLPNEKMPCLACLRSGIPQPKQIGNIDYSTATGPEDYQGQPGLHAMVDFITCTEILISLGILLREIPGSRLARLIDPEHNFLLVGGALGAGFYRFKKPFDIFFQPLSGPRKSCVICQNKTVSIAKITKRCN